MVISPKKFICTSHSRPRDYTMEIVGYLITKENRSIKSKYPEVWDNDRNLLSHLIFELPLHCQSKFH